MLLGPVVRLNRAVTAILVLHNEPLNAIAISESVSFLAIILNPDSLRNFIASMYAISYAPFMTYEILKRYENQSRPFLQAELIATFLLITFILLEHTL